MSETNCKLCGEPMPPGEEMFFYHGYSGPCPKPPLKGDPPKESDRLRQCEQREARLREVIEKWVPKIQRWAPFSELRETLDDFREMLDDFRDALKYGREEPKA